LLLCSEQSFFFHFPEEEERQRRRQGTSIAEEALNLSDYGRRWKRAPLPSYASYDTGEFKIMCQSCQKFQGKTQTHMKQLLEQLLSATAINTTRRKWLNLRRFFMK